MATADRTSAARRAAAAGLDPSMTLERWDESAAVSFDRSLLWAEPAGWLER